MTPRMRAMHDRLAEENGHYVPAAVSTCTEV